MSIQLTTAISGGDLEPANLTHVRIELFSFSIREPMIILLVVLGSMNGSEFVEARNRLPGLTVKEFRIEGADYQAIVAATASAQGAVLYDEVAAALYQWLLTNNHFIGTIV